MLKQLTNPRNLVPLLINIMKNMLKLRYFLKQPPEDMDAEASAHRNVNNYQFKVATAYPKGTEYLDAESIFLSEVPGYHKLIVAGARDEVNIQNKLVYDTTIDSYVANIDKNDNNT